MPIIDGKVVRSRYSSLKLGEISSVDNPAQPGARASIMKRHDAVQKVAPSLIAVAVAKYVCSDDGAHTFNEVLQVNQFDEKIWPMTDALTQSIRSIMGDKDVKPSDKEGKITTSVDEFLAAVREHSPTAEKSLAAIISKGTGTMKTVEELTVEVNSLTSKLALATGEVTTLKAKLTDAEQKAKDAEEAKEKMGKSLSEATEETLKVGEREIKKSAVGVDTFEAFKAQQDITITAQMEKRASEEFPAVVGTTAEKGLVLKAVATMGEETQKAFNAILTSAQAMASKAFETFGRRDGGAPVDADTQKAVATYKGKVADIMKRDGITESAAMSKARSECPDEFAAAYPRPAEAE